MRMPGFRAALGAAVAIILAVSATVEAGAWQPLTGRVASAADGAGLADVEIRAQVSAPASVLAGLAKPQPFVVGRTDGDGNFRVDLPREAAPIGWERVDHVVLLFARDGLRSHAEHLVRAQAGRPIQIRLDRSAGAARIEDGPRRRLESLRVAGAPVVFVLPFALRGPTAAASEELGEQLRAALIRMLRRHFSAFTLATPLPDVVLRGVDLKALELDEALPPEALVEPLDALAVIGGRIETGAVRGRIVVVSEFAVRSAAARLPSTYRVEDSVSADPGQALAELERQMVPRWARMAVLALAASELRAAGAKSDAQGLRGVQQLVAQELRRTGRGNADLVPQAQALLQDAEAALRRLGHR
ncbi:MAG: hypothetical protein JNK67_25765 [Alphaproteobacteria bacterium]|nr:hypothetical protein [Alphaproteobacteria bacterium]